MKFSPPALSATMALLLLSTTTSTTKALQVGDEICVEGFVMDFFCIERGTLFDNPSVTTLANPELHSVHCLVDVAPCLASPFEVLHALPNPTSEIKFSRGWRLDDPSKDLILQVARGVGRANASPRCTTCTEDMGGMLDRGFHAGMVATVVELASGSTPATINIARAEHSSADAPFCGINGSGNTGLEAASPDSVIVGSGSNFEQKARIHGALMLIGWGWLLPSGVIIANQFRHRPNGLWFQLHRAVQTLGLICTITGFAIALRNFDVFTGTGNLSYKHGVMGITTMVLGLLQPLNAIVRPHPNVVGQEPNTLRTVWEFVHKGLGYSAILLAVATIGIGTTLLPKPEDQKTYQMAYGIGAGCMLLLLFGFGVFDGATYQPVPDTDGEKPKDPTEQVNEA